MENKELKKIYDPAFGMTRQQMNLKAEMYRRFEDLADNVNGYFADSREKSLALTKIEEALFWVNAIIERNRIDE